MQDLGCGPGLHAASILAEFKYADLTAFDLTEEMLEARRSNLRGTNRVAYRLGDFRTDDFRSNYDLIAASLSLHHLTLSERPAFLRRAYDSLKAGGSLITSEVIIDESSLVRERLYQLWRDYMAGQDEDGMSWYQKHLAKDHPAEMSTLISMLSDAGFDTAECFWRYLNFAIMSAHKAPV